MIFGKKESLPEEPATLSNPVTYIHKAVKPLIVEKEQRAIFDARGDLELIPGTPHSKKILIYRKKQ